MSDSDSSVEMKVVKNKKSEKSEKKKKSKNIEIKPDVELDGQDNAVVKNKKSEKSEKKKKSNVESDGQDNAVVKNKKSEQSEKTKKSKKIEIQTDVESDGQDNACVKMSAHFIKILQKTISDGDEDVFMDTLKKTPFAVNIHYLHFLFYISRDNKDITKILIDYNNKYNIVSKYFLKAIRSENNTKNAMEMLVDVTNEIIEKTPLDEIKNIRYFSPEFIVMVTIESGNIPVYERIVEEWELSEDFENSMDLIAAFFGIKKFFSDPEKYTDRRDLIISAICGGSTKLVSRIMRKTDSKYMTEYTLRKVRAMCIPNSEMLEFLERRYGLEFV